MNTAPDPTTSTAIAATDLTKAAAAPRIKLLSHGFCIDHPDPELGEQLMADALGVTDREAMHGILRQLVRASVSGESSDEVNLAFMISMVKSIRPRDAVEAMLVAQMVSVHVMAMRCAQHLASADDIAQHDSAARALGRLARTFPAQIEALNRYRSHGEPAITVQNVKVADGGRASPKATKSRGCAPKPENPRFSMRHGAMSRMRTSVAIDKIARRVPAAQDCSDLQSGANRPGTGCFTGKEDDEVSVIGGEGHCGRPQYLVRRAVPETCPSRSDRLCR
jgi:hypothetical protein